jgi:hypothetical protein
MSLLRYPYDFRKVIPRPHTYSIKITGSGVQVCNDGLPQARSERKPKRSRVSNGTFIVGKKKNKNSN